MATGLSLKKEHCAWNLRLSKTIIKYMSHSEIKWKMKSILGNILRGHVYQPPGEGNGNPLQYSCLENPKERWACDPIVHGVTKNWTQLSTRLTNSNWHVLNLRKADAEWENNMLWLQSYLVNNRMRFVLLTFRHIKKERHYFANKGLSSQGYGFSSSHVWMSELDYEESWALKNWCFWTVVLEKTLENPLDSKEIQPVHPKRNQSEYSLEGLMLKLKL